MLSAPSQKMSEDVPLLLWTSTAMTLFPFLNKFAGRVMELWSGLPCAYVVEAVLKLAFPDGML